jgi:hypothetical protein
MSDLDSDSDKPFLTFDELRESDALLPRNEQSLKAGNEITVKKGNKSVKCVFASFTPSDGYFSVMLPDRTFKNVKEKGVQIRIDKKDYVHLPLNGGKKRRLTKKRKTLRKSKKSRRHR